MENIRYEISKESKRIKSQIWRGMQRQAHVHITNLIYDKILRSISDGLWHDALDKVQTQIEKELTYGKHHL